jgi:outer membrane receptor protein involved in Fe transport
LLWRPHLDLDLSLGVYNLGNTRYEDRIRLDYPPAKQEARTVRLALNWRFGS